MTTKKPEIHVHVGVELCAVFGVEPLLVTAIDLHFGLNDVATVTIKRQVTKDEAAALGGTIRNYNILPVPESASRPILDGVAAHAVVVSLSDLAVQKAARAITNPKG